MEADRLGNLAAAQRVKFGVSVIVASNLGINCGIRRDGDATGQPVELEAQLVAYGQPIEPTSVSLEIDQPAYGRGALYSDMQGHGDADMTTQMTRFATSWPGRSRTTHASPNGRTAS